MTTRPTPPTPRDYWATVTDPRDRAAVFGDIEPADVYDPTAPPDPEHVARRLHELRVVVDELAGDDPVLAGWDDLAPDARAVGVALVAELLAWLHREGTDR